MRKFVVCLALLSSACASARYISGPDGKPRVVITCKRDHEYCLERAGEECPNGYDIDENTGDTQTVAVANYDSSGGYAYAGPRYRGRMVIKCH